MTLEEMKKRICDRCKIFNCNIKKVCTEMIWAEEVWQAAQAEQQAKIAELERKLEIATLHGETMRLNLLKMNKIYYRRAIWLLSRQKVLQIANPGKLGAKVAVNKIIHDDSLWNEDNTLKKGDTP